MWTATFERTDGLTTTVGKRLGEQVRDRFDRAGGGSGASGGTLHPSLVGEGVYGEAELVVGMGVERLQQLGGSTT
jgi:hypothetical protein